MLSRKDTDFLTIYARVGAKNRPAVREAYRAAFECGDISDRSVDARVLKLTRQPDAQRFLLADEHEHRRQLAEESKKTTNAVFENERSKLKLQQALYDLAIKTAAACEGQSASSIGKFIGEAVKLTDRMPDDAMDSADEARADRERLKQLKAKAAPEPVIPPAPEPETPKTMDQLAVETLRHVPTDNLPRA